MRWFDWVRPDKCEIPGCERQPDRKTHLGSARVWLCAEHAESLGAQALIKGRSKRNAA